MSRRARSISAMPPARRGSSAAPTGSSRSSAGVPRAMTWPQWITETRSARRNRKRMSCSMIDDRQRAASARRSARRAARSPSAPRPAVGSSRNSRRGSAASATRDLERAPLAVGQVARAGACSLPARPTRASTAAACARRAASAPQVAPDVEAARGALAAARPARCRARESSSNRFMTWNEREMPVGAIAARRQAGDVLAGEAHAAAIGRVAAGQHVEAGRLAGAVRAHDPRQLALLERER